MQAIDASSTRSGFHGHCSGPEAEQQPRNTETLHCSCNELQDVWVEARNYTKLLGA